MDRLGGGFGAYDDTFGDSGPFGLDPDDEREAHAPLAPPSPVGQDERRMQVRAYNLWASLLGDAALPDIADLRLETLDDFGPFGILLHFGGKRGIDNPAVHFLGEKLARECGIDTKVKRLSDVPGRSLLSRITDHYLQILANQAPIGFEAEFTNRHGAEVLYRGILLPWSSDGVTIDFVYGVINWKELADAEVAERLLSAVEGALEAPIPPYEGQDMDRMLDLSAYTEIADDAGDGDGDVPAPAAAGNTPRDIPQPTFGAPLAHALPASDGDWDSDEDMGGASDWSAGFAGFGEEDPVYAVDYGALGLEDGEEDEDLGDVIDPLADASDGPGLAALVSRSARVKQSVLLPGAPSQTPQVPADYDATMTLEQRVRAVIPQGHDIDSMPAFGIRASSPADEPFDLEPAFEERAEEACRAETTAPTAGDVTTVDEGEADGLYDCLAAARELAQTARSNEDRGRKALYQAVARAYDFSIEAAASPADFEELLTENGLSVQDRAPMTPIVKLVFGADYDKTRLTEYAAVLSYAHRTGVARGTLDTVLAAATGGLKGVVKAERQARREAAGAAAPARASVSEPLARKLRKLDSIAIEALAPAGAEFALVMVRRLPSGELAVLGEVPEDLALIEKAARKLLS